jgi:hypothetical protein
VSSSPSDTKVTLKRLKGCYSFSNWGTVTNISITQTSSPTAIEFDACVAIPCGDTENHCYIHTRAKTIYMFADPATGWSKHRYEGGHSPCYVWSVIR